MLAPLVGARVANPLRDVGVAVLVAQRLASAELAVQVNLVAEELVRTGERLALGAGVDVQFVEVAVGLEIAARDLPAGDVDQNVARIPGQGGDHPGARSLALVQGAVGVTPGLALQVGHEPAEQVTTVSAGIVLLTHDHRNAVILDERRAVTLGPFSTAKVDRRLVHGVGAPDGDVGLDPVRRDDSDDVLAVGRDVHSTNRLLPPEILGAGRGGAGGGRRRGGLAGQGRRGEGEAQNRQNDGGQAKGTELRRHGAPSKLVFARQPRESFPNGNEIFRRARPTKRPSARNLTAIANSPS